MQIEDIKSVKFLNNILYIAGKSGENNNSINIWDLRNAKLLYEGEKNQEILSLGVLNENIYYSRKTNNVCGCEYEKNKIKIFNPPLVLLILLLVLLLLPILLLVLFLMVKRLFLLQGIGLLNNEI